MDAQGWKGLVVVGVLGIAGAVAVHQASVWLSSDAREIRDCEATHFTCVATVQGKPRLEALKHGPPQFDGEARHCAEHLAWENAVFRANFDCEMSARVEKGSCAEVETTCELSKG